LPLKQIFGKSELRLLPIIPNTNLIITGHCPNSKVLKKYNHKIMKIKHLKLFIAILFFSVFFSCEKEEDLSISDQVSIVESSINNNKFEGYVPNYDKQALENIPCGDDLSDSILAILANSNSKISLKSTSGKAGVLISSVISRDNGIVVCSNPHLQVHMDCEDNNPASKQSGWTGGSIVDGNKNIDLVFYITDVSNFTFLKDYSYAILRLDANLPTGVSSFTRNFDNEDKNNVNKAILEEIGYMPKYVDSYGPCVFNSNTRLLFYYFPKNSSSSTNTFPYLGVSYGVLGSFGSNQGYIYSDDEDKDNKNSMYAQLYNRTTGTYTSSINKNISGIIDVGSNTKLYMSKAR
jgi:hypothetical protein